jgi:hypothetical protein
MENICNEIDEKLGTRIKDLNVEIKKFREYFRYEKLAFSDVQKQHKSLMNWQIVKIKEYYDNKMQQGLNQGAI